MSAPAHTSPATRFAAWVLARLTAGTHREALCGDLLEELSSGRDVRWYNLQVLRALGIELRQRIQPTAQPLVFAAGWSTLYPLWKLPIKTVQWLSQPWPLSSCLVISNGVLPAIAFVWLGLIVYLLAFSPKDRRPTPFQVVLALSASLSVLLAATIATLQHLSDSGFELASITRNDFYLTFHLLTISLPLTLTLLSAILLAQPRGSKLARAVRAHRHPDASQIPTRFADPSAFSLLPASHS